MPRVRNALLLLLGSRRVSDLASREQKEKLQADVLAEIQAVMAAETGKPQIEAVYFNSFVMQ
jgi:flagellar protein FliL